MSTIKVAFPTDMHYPFQDDHAVSVALQIVQDFDPDILVAGSDGIDFYAISTYSKDPKRVKSTGLQSEIDAWRKGQREWNDAAPRAYKPFIIGNHEDRLRRWVWEHPGASDLRSLEMSRLLELDSLGIELAPNNEVIVGDVLLIKHGDFVRSHSAFSAKAELMNEVYQFNVMTGHTHRGGSYFVTARGNVFHAHECFCLCDTSPEYKKNPNWQQGISLATVWDGHVSVEQIPIFTNSNGKVAHWRDREYRSA